MTHAEPRAHLRTLAENRDTRDCPVCAAAHEIIRAGDGVREAERVGLNTEQHAYRKRTADAVWDAVKACPHTCTLAPRQREAS